MENKNTQRVGTTARRNTVNNASELFVRFNLSMLNAYDMVLVREKYGIAGWGIVLYIMKYLLERRTKCRAPLYAVAEIAHACHKNQKTILQLIYDLPALFTIEPDGQIFTSPYLVRFFVKNSTEKEKSNRNLNKLTNGSVDNQAINFPKNYELELEQRTTKEKKRESRREKVSAVVADSSVDKTISEDAEAVDADVAVEEKVAEDTKAVAVANASADKTVATPRRAVPKPPARLLLSQSAHPRYSPWRPLRKPHRQPTWLHRRPTRLHNPTKACPASCWPCSMPTTATWRASNTWSTSLCMPTSSCAATCCCGSKATAECTPNAFGRPPMPRTTWPTCCVPAVTPVPNSWPIRTGFMKDKGESPKKRRSLPLPLWAGEK